MSTLHPIPADSWQIARGDTRTPRAYQVHLDDGTVIGTVRNHSFESWRKAGRIRTSLIGYAFEWRYEHTGDLGRPRSAHTRRDAVGSLLAEHTTRTINLGHREGKS